MNTAIRRPSGTGECCVHSPVVPGLMTGLHHRLIFGVPPGRFHASSNSRRKGKFQTAPPGRGL
jgi:hypothetical protein